jgi:hypothetical protein
MDRTRMDRGYFSFSLKFFLVLPICLSEAKKKRSERRGAKESKRSFQRLKQLEAAGEPAIHRLARIAKMNNLEKEHYHVYQ